MKSTLHLITGIVCLFNATTFTFGQTTYSTSVNASGGENYSVNITITPTAIVPVQSSCDWGYNYDVAYDYNIQFVGGNNPSLYSLAGYLTCGSNQGIYFDLPNNGGSGSDVTQGNPWTNNSDCATATLESLDCNSIDLVIEGAGIPNQTITLDSATGDNGDDSEWDTNGNSCDTNAFIGTTNSSDLRFRTNNIERMRLTEDGKFGIGVTNPLEKFELQGTMKLSEDIIFSSYVDLTDTTEKFLFVDKNGKSLTKSMSNVQNIIYSVDCFTGKEGNSFGGSTLITLPSWASTIFDNRQVLYTGVNCPTWVGIGTNEPLTRLDVRGAGRFDKGVGIGDVAVPEASLHLQNYTITNSTDPMFEKLIIVKNENNEKVLQLENNGLLRAREIKVDEEVWPDYVFKPNYELMPLNKVKEFIAQNGHLPNVPSAEEIEADGVNLGETARITMEKVEELTLYLIEQQEQLEKQKVLLKQQQQLIQAQQELVEKQQQEIDAMKIK